MKKTICFAGLLSETNLGDIVIIESTEGLYKKSLAGKGNFEFKRLNLQFGQVSFLNKVVRKLKRLATEKLKLDGNRLEIEMLKKHYRSQLKEAELVVLVGGGLIKYKYQGVFLYLIALIETAEELGIPVVINAAGVEGYSETDPRCQLLKMSLNKDIVKSITTRDDLETLSKKYMHQDSKIHIDKVADPAVYSDEIYKTNKQESDTYGIGLVRGGIFLDNERQLTPEEVAIFYADLISEVESRGLKYQMFTNGSSSDNELLPLIKNKLGRNHLELIVPKQDDELVNVISTFTTVIAARLHANIISYSLNIPSIGLVWNDKLALFGDDIGYPERFFEYNQLDAKKIVDAAVLANEQGYEQGQWNKYKSTAKSNIDVIVNKWIANEL
ncbi:polysaccharide pyruvyl transferase family protein [uncultured Psychrobacter sp.]|uniref:polysaccharide pyruvyl transferase family protein n=1 Tax=uncultured Psychrobacter sp. TaxID=259303 RepID=UPI00262AC8B8|nr:polysaccharide pyruvyl transferase family protein [uncultured Psychrobacter sp.]